MDIEEKYYNKDGTVNEGAWLRRIMETSGYHGLSKLAACIDAGILTEEKTGITAGITERLVDLFIRQSEGDKIAGQQIEIIWKILFPEQFALDKKDIEKTFSALDKFTEKLLAQGFEVRKMMAFLSRAVRPVPPSKSVLTGQVELTEFDEWYEPEFHAASGAFERLEKTSEKLKNLAIDVLLHQKRIFNKITKEKKAKYLNERLRDVKNWETDLRYDGKLPKQIISQDKVELPFGIKPKWLVVCGGEETEHLLYLDFSDKWKKA